MRILDPHIQHANRAALLARDIERRAEREELQRRQDAADYAERLREARSSLSRRKARMRQNALARLDP